MNDVKNYDNFGGDPGPFKHGGMSIRITHQDGTVTDLGDCDVSQFRAEWQPPEPVGGSWTGTGDSDDFVVRTARAEPKAWKAAEGAPCDHTKQRVHASDGTTIVVVDVCDECRCIYAVDTVVLS